MPLLRRKEMALPLSVPEFFGDLSWFGLIELHFYERLIAFLVQQPLLIAYVEHSTVIEVGVFLRVSV